MPPQSPLAARVGKYAMARRRAGVNVGETIEDPEGALPRYRTQRKTAGGDHRYVFAARFKRNLDKWLVIGETAWTVMDDATMAATYMPSNREARAVWDRAATRRQGAMSDTQPSSP